jgi:hypothetical protein
MQYIEELNPIYTSDQCPGVYCAGSLLFISIASFLGALHVSRAKVDPGQEMVSTAGI